MAMTLQQFNAQLDRDAAITATHTLEADSAKQTQADRAIGNRIEDRSVAAGSLPASTRIDADTAKRWVEVDANDLANMRNKERRDEALNHIGVNRGMSQAYHEALSQYKTLSAAVDAAQVAENGRLAAKNDRKNRDAVLVATDVSAAPPAAQPRSSAAAAALADANAQHEEDRARLEAFASMKRQEALIKHPTLERAYDLQDASKAFIDKNLSHDQKAADGFRALTDEFIARKLIRGEELPELKKLEHVREKELEIER